MKYRQNILCLLCVAALGLGAEASAAGHVRWNFSDFLIDWGDPKGMMLIQEDDSLLLDVVDPDSRMVARELAIPGDKFARLCITYRAEGFVGATNGELFYGTEKFPGIDGSRFFPIGSLIADGRTQELLIDVRGWKGKGTINILRLDLVNQAPGQIYLEKIEFQPYTGN